MLHTFLYPSLLPVFFFISPSLTLFLFTHPSLGFLHPFLLFFPLHFISYFLFLSFSHQYFFHSNFSRFRFSYSLSLLPCLWFNIPLFASLSIIFSTFSHFPPFSYFSFSYDLFRAICLHTLTLLLFFLPSRVSFVFLIFSSPHFFFIRSIVLPLIPLLPPRSVFFAIFFIILAFLTFPSPFFISSCHAVDFFLPFPLYPENNNLRLPLLPGIVIFSFFLFPLLIFVLSVAVSYLCLTSTSLFTKHSSERPLSCKSPLTLFNLLCFPSFLVLLLFFF